MTRRTGGEAELISAALEGHQNTELYFGASTRLSIRAFHGEVASFSLAETAGVSSRVVLNERVGSAYSERVTPEELGRVVAEARRNAVYPAPDVGNRLREEPGVDAFDAGAEDFAGVAVSRKREIALAIERRALSSDKRIVNVPYASYGDVTGRSVLGNTFGVLQEYTYRYCYAFVEVMASEGDETEVGIETVVARSFDEIDAESIASSAVERALARLGSIEPASGRYRIVFDEEAASDLFGAFVAGAGSPFYGENIQKGRSRLDAKVGAKIGSPLFNLVDEPSAGLTPRRFDDEGVPTSTLAFVAEGVFASVIHNIYSAARSGAESTGHGRRGGYRGTVATALHNPCLTNGAETPDALLRKMGSGLLVTEIEGLHAGLNPVSGDFSLSAVGFMVENGERTRPIRNMVVAGNFYELVERIVGKANDRREITRRRFSSPSILIDDLSVSGS